MPHDLSESLMRLASVHNVSTEYWDWRGTNRQVSAETLVAVLEAMGVEAGDEHAVARSLAAAENDSWLRTVPETLVVRAGAYVEVPVNVDHGERVDVWIELGQDPALGCPGGWAHPHQVDKWVEPRMVGQRLIGRATFALPQDLPLGWHTLCAWTPGGGRTTGTLVVCPERLEVPADLDQRRAWGMMAQLYSVRSAGSWGIGDLTDLADLAWTVGADLGGDFLLVNPLHAAEPVSPLTPSPYWPTSRTYLNPLYVRPQDIPEVAYLDAEELETLTELAESASSADLEAEILDRDACWAAKKPALQMVFAAGLRPARASQLAAFRREGGADLERYATWCALVEHFGTVRLPAEVADPDAPAVADLLSRPDVRRRVDFHCWLQWVADEQLDLAQHRARQAGMRIGLMTDLAVGVHPLGADAWAGAGVLAAGTTVGAPPDFFNQQGQDWNQPPLRPDALVRTGYASYRRMLRGVLRHAGAVRIDHILGLFRLWWIPAGANPQEGAYVRYDHEAMVGILALEARRAGAMVIGEDLGLVEPWVRRYLSERGVLGTSVLWFEKADDDVSPRPPEQYRRLALSTVTTHDIPPTAGYLAAEHVRLRDRLGLLTEPVDKVLADARAEVDGVVGMLRAHGLVGADPCDHDVLVGVHRLLLSTPSLLLGLSLADAVGEHRTQNQPGTDTEYPNWKIPLADAEGKVVLLEDLLANPTLRELVAVFAPS